MSRGPETHGTVIPSLAILKVNWDAGEDYIENFVPFVAECLRTAPQPEVALPELQAAIRNTFRLEIPQAALRTILRRAVRRGYVDRTEGIYRRNDDALASVDISRVRDDVLRKYEALIGRLIGFCRERFRIEWSTEQADAALLACLEESSSAILAAALGARPIVAPERAVPHAQFVVGSFVAEIYESDPQGFEFLETVVKGSMLAGVLLLPDIGGVQQRFQQVEVYFDTPFVLQALGLEGEGRQAPRLELIHLLYEQNANLRIFEHTLSEIRSVLSAAARALRDYASLRHAYGPTIQYMVDSGYTASDVELTIARLEKSLRGVHIQVKAKPPYSHRLGLDEAKLGSILQQEVGYHREEALHHDVDSLAAIHRLRRGLAHLHIESCDAVFVTTNDALARGCMWFFAEEYDQYRDSVVAHCVPDDLFTTIVWLKKPLSAPDLPRKKIIAACYAALNPPDKLWKRYLEQIDRLEKRGDISKEDYDLLRFSLVSRGALMDVTLGGVDAFAEGTVAEVLAAAEAAARAEPEAALRAEVAGKEAAERSAADARREATEAASRFEARRQAQLDRVRSVSTTAGRWVARVALGIGLVLVALVTYLTLVPAGLPGGAYTPGGLALVVALGVLVFANLAFGESVTSITRRLEVAVSRLTQCALIRLTEP